MGLALGPLALAAGLAAQTAPMPALPPQAEPSPGPESPGQATTAPGGPGELRERPQPWEYSLGVGGGWDSNVDFLVPDGASGATLVPRGSAARTFRSPRGQLRALATGRWIAYTDGRHQDRGYADFGLEGRYRASSRTSWKGNATYSLGHSDTSQPLLQQGVLLPLTRTQTLAGALGLLHGLGTRTALRIDGRLYGVSFETPELVDQSSLRGTVALERRLGARSTAALEYSLEGVLADQRGEAYRTHFGSIQWTRVLSTRTSLLLEGGASHTPDAGRAGLDRETSFFGGASLGFRSTRSSLALFVRREVAPAFGTGVSRLALRCGLSGAASFGRDWSLEISANHVRPDTPSLALETYPSSDDATLSAGRRVGGRRRLRVAGEAAYRHRGATGTLASVGSLQVGLFVSLVGAPRPAGQDAATGR